MKYRYCNWTKTVCSVYLYSKHFTIECFMSDNIPRDIFVLLYICVVIPMITDAFIYVCFNTHLPCILLFSKSYALSCRIWFPPLYRCMLTKQKEQPFCNTFILFVRIQIYKPRKIIITLLILRSDYFHDFSSLCRCVLIPYVIVTDCVRFSTRPWCEDNPSRSIAYTAT